MKKKIINSILLTVLAIICAVNLSACFELTDEDNPEGSSNENASYESFFDDSFKHVWFDIGSLSTINTINISNSSVYMGDTDKFVADTVKDYGYQAYKYVVVTIKRDCVLKEVVLYGNCNKEQSGKKALNSIGLQFFKKDKDFDFNESWITSAATAIFKQDKKQNDEQNLYKLKKDAVLSMRNKSWNDGMLVSLKNGVEMAAGEKFIIKLVENCDFNGKEVDDGTDEDGNKKTKLKFTENTDNDVFLKLDKIMFRVEKK